MYHIYIMILYMYIYIYHLLKYIMIYNISLPVCGFVGTFDCLID